MGNLVAEMRIYDVYLMLHDQVPLENAEHGFFINHFSFLSFCFFSFLLLPPLPRINPKHLSGCQLKRRIRIRH